MYFSIRHITKFHYSVPVSTSVTEVRMHPRSEGRQRTLSFEISVIPKAKVFSYRDYLGNNVHHFDIPGFHNQLTICTQALVEMRPFAELPATLDTRAWQELDDIVAREDHWDMLVSSQFARPTELLDRLAKELDVSRRSDPMSLLCELNGAINRTFAYVPKSTRVDSPIDDALRARQGVCQDFAHIMIALIRQLGIPCRYVSGYLCPGPQTPQSSADNATHAWVEALLPGLGWIGFDPTNNTIAKERHIRTAIGRDYADVPPTRGVFKGESESKSELSVAVQVVTSEPPVLEKVVEESYDNLTTQEQQQQQQ